MADPLLKDLKGIPPNDPFLQEPRRNSLDDIIEQAQQDLELERKRQESIITAEEPDKVLGSINKVEKQIENESPEVQRSVLDKAYNPGYFDRGVRGGNINRPTQQENKPLVKPGLNPGEVGQWQGFINAIKSGLKQGKQARAVIGLEGGLEAEERLKEIALLQAEIRGIPRSKAYNEFNDPKKTFGQSLKRLALDPIEITSQLVVESIASFFPTQVAGMITGAGIGAGVGSIVPGIGTVAGFGSGLLYGGITSAGLTSLGMEYSGKMLEVMEELGVNTEDPNDLARGFSDNTIMSEARELGLRKGVPIAIFDLVSAGVAGRFMKPGKTLVSKLVQGSKEVGTQAVLGSSGEAVGQLSAGEEIQPSAIIAEGIAEIGQSAPSGATRIATQKFKTQKQEKAKAKGIEALESGQLKNLSDQEITDFASSLTPEERMEVGIGEDGKFEIGSDLGKEVVRRNLDMDKFPETEKEIREANARLNVKERQLEGTDFTGALISKVEELTNIEVEREYLGRTLADEAEEQGWTEEQTKQKLKEHGLDENSDPSEIDLTGTSFGGSIKISTAGTPERMAQEYVAVQEEMAEEYYKAEQQNNSNFDNEIEQERKAYHESTGEQDTGESNIEWFSTKAVHFATQGKVHESIGAKLRDIFKRFIDTSKQILKDAIKLRRAIKEGKIPESLVSKLKEATDFKTVGKKVDQAKKIKKLKPKNTFRISENFNFQNLPTVPGYTLSGTSDFKAGTKIKSIVRGKDMINTSSNIPPDNAIYELKKINIKKDPIIFGDKTFSSVTRDDFLGDDYDGYQTRTFEDIKQRMEKGGMESMEPLIFDNFYHSDELEMIDGHHRAIIANELGWDEIYAYVRKPDQDSYRLSKVQQVAKAEGRKATPDGGVTYRISEVGKVDPVGVFVIGADMVARDLDGKLNPFGLRYTENFQGFQLSKAGATKLVKNGKKGFNTVAVIAYDKIKESQVANPSFQNRVKEKLVEAIGKRKLNKLLKENNDDVKKVSGIVNKEIQEANKGKAKKDKKEKINMEAIALDNAEPDSPQLRRKIIYVGTLKEIRTGKDRIRKHDVYPAEQIFDTLVELKEPIPIDDLVADLPDTDFRKKGWGMMVTQTNFMMTADESNIAQELIKMGQEGKDVFTGTPNPDYQFYSSETDQTLTVEEAISKSGDEKEFKSRQFVSQLDEQLGLGTATRGSVGISEKYGNESAIVTRFFGKQKQELLEYRGAWTGLMFDQKDVTNFIGDDNGKHSLLKITIDKTNLIYLNEVMQNNGILSQTIRIRGNKQDILLWDKGDINTKLVHAIAEDYNAKEYTKQKGEFKSLTNESDRKEARKAFIKIIQDYQSKTDIDIPKAFTKFLPDFYKRKSDQEQLLKQLKAKPKATYRLTPTFYSQAERVVTDKFPPTMKSQSVENFLKKNQVKPEEIEWLDLESLLKGKLKITKEELQEWIQANNIEIQDVMVGKEVYEDIVFRIGDLEVYRNNQLINYTREFDSDDPLGNLKMSIIEDFGLNLYEIATNPKRELLHYLEEKRQDQLDEIDIAEENEDFSEADEFRANADYISELENKINSNDFEFTIKQTSEAKYESYQLPGEKEDYRELLLTLPKSEDDFKTRHFKQPNILAHVRFNTRISPTGERILFIEELQSDWHTKGREKGYKGKPYVSKYSKEESQKIIKDTVVGIKEIGKESKLDNFAPALREYELNSQAYEMTKMYTSNIARIAVNQAYTDTRLPSKLRERVFALSNQLGNLEEEKRLKSQDRKKTSLQVPNAPFKGNGWIELIMKRMLRHASDNNFDRIAWTTSNQQIDRWKNDLRQNVDQIQWQKNNKESYDQWVEGGMKGRFIANNVIINGLKNKENKFNQTIPLEGETTINGQKVTLEGLLGKQMATQIRNSNKRTGIIEGDDLTIGGQGFKVVYDFAISKILNKMGKKFGAKVDQVTLQTKQVEGFESAGFAGKYQPSIKITRKMKESALKGQPTFRLSKMSSTDEVLESSSFKKWFKGSQVVDKQGKPLVVYHGTTQNFDTFRQNIDRSGFGEPGQEIYLTDDPKYASRYATLARENTYPQGAMGKVKKDWSKIPSGANVLPVYVSMQNPKLIIDKGTNIYYSKEQIAKMKKEGYDGVILFRKPSLDKLQFPEEFGKVMEGKQSPPPNSFEEIIVFEPTQVKSVFNKGTFNPNDPRISFRLSPKNIVTPLSKVYQEQKGDKKSYTKKDFEQDLTRLGYDEDMIKSAMDMFGIIRMKQIDTTDPTPIEKELKKLQEREIKKSEIKSRIKRAYRLGATEKEKEITKLQKIVTNYARENLPKGLYQKSEVTGILAKVRDAKRFRELGTAMERIDRVIDKVSKRGALAKWNKTIKKKATVKKVGGIPKGQVGADVQEIVNDIKSVYKLSEAEVESKLEILLDVIDKSTDGQPTDLQSMQMHNFMTYGAIKSKTPEQIANATQDFDILVTQGRMQIIEETQAYKERMASVRAEILDVITGGAGAQTQQGEQALGLKPKDWSQFRNMLSQFDNMSQSLEYVFDKLSKLDKTSRPLQSFINNYFMPQIRQARLAEYGGTTEMITMMKNKLEEIYGLKGGKLRRKLNENIEKTVTITHHDQISLEGIKGDIVESTLTYNQAYKKWMELKDPTLHKTFVKMGYDVNKVINQIEQQLPKEVLAWAEWQLYEFYPMYYQRVNETFRRRFFVNLPFNPMYSPIKRSIGAKSDTADPTLDKKKTPFGSVQNGSMKSRVGSQEELIWVDGDTVLLSHISEMEHFIAYTDVLRELRSVFMSRDISRSIQQFHGKPISRVLNKFMDDIARGGIDKSNSVEGIDYLRANFSRSAIGLNPVVFLKQLGSIPAYASDMPMSHWLAQFTLLSNPIEVKRMLKTLSESKLLDMRYEVGMERDIALAMRSVKPGNVFTGTDMLNNIAYLLTKLGDKTAIYLGGWSLYKYEYKQAKKNGATDKEAKEIAMKKFEASTLRAQQSGEIEDLADVQRSGTYAKLFTMFMTSPNQYYRMAIGGYRNIYHGRGSKVENLRRIFVAQFVLPTLFTFISNGFEYDEEDHITSLILFPFAGIMFFGQAYATIIDRLGGKNYGSAGEVSILEPFNDMARLASRIRQIQLGKKELDSKQVIAMTNDIIIAMSRILGLPYAGVKRSVLGAIKVVKGEAVNPIRETIGFKPKKKEKKKPKRVTAEPTFSN